MRVFHYGDIFVLSQPLMYSTVPLEKRRDLYKDERPSKKAVKAINCSLTVLIIITITDFCDYNANSDCNTSLWVTLLKLG